jgi:predicted adenine nucleotide alpha hydrolase (AANH) superfamily ATPase
MPLATLFDESWHIELYYYNPNIHPREEYERRLATLNDYVDSLNSAYGHAIKLHTGTYDPEYWEAEVGVLGGPYPLIEGAENHAQMLSARAQRCSACYRLRFTSLAARASEQGFDAVSTTLSVSPYQYTSEIAAALLDSAAAYDLVPLARDWRSLYREAVKTSRELGMYRQNYCGCRFSALEAELERNARKEAGRRQKRQTKAQGSPSPAPFTSVRQ